MGKREWGRLDDSQTEGDFMPHLSTKRCTPESSSRTGMLTLRALAVVALSFATTVSEAQRPPRPLHAGFTEELVRAAVAQTAVRVTYDGSYRKIPYPGGDVPDHTGVCTDLVIRAYRKVGIDLQQQVHEDMASAFSSYPKIWGLSRPDPNIDHRRVPNLQTYFRRLGAERPVSRDPRDYLPGDLVTWRLPGNLPHIGLVTNRRSRDGKRHLVVHNIGRGPELEDMLFDYPITGHYRYRGE
jgi:uncharacterized protein YijF (DUF1287 family)